MNSLKITIILLLFTTVSNAQFKIGGKLAYGSEIESLGIGAKAIYELNEKISLSGELNYFFGSNTSSTISTSSTINSQGFNIGEQEIKTSLTTLNTDLHYNLSNLNDLSLYAIGGLNFSFFSTELSSENNFSGVEVQSSFDNSETFIGLNIGIGGSYPITNNLDVFSELKYIINDLDQIVFSAGIVYSLD